MAGTLKVLGHVREYLTLASIRFFSVIISCGAHRYMYVTITMVIYNEL
jgi:hypothetical protein